MTEDLDELAKRFRYWGENLTSSSPLYSKMSPTIGRHESLVAIMLDAPESQRYPMLFFAAIHYLLAATPDEPLRDFYATLVGEPRTGDPTDALLDFCSRSEVAIRGIVARRSTQTNEVQRTAALLPAIVRAAASGEPLALIEIGCSAGLNLLWDRFAFDYGSGIVGDPASPVVLRPEVRGRLDAPRALPRIAWRLGIDRAPLDPRNDDDVAWLRACIWPEHVERARRLDSAVALARSVDPVNVLHADALESLAHAIASAPLDATVCVFHSAVLGYIPAGGPERIVEILKAAGREIYWIASEGAHTMSELLGIEIANRTDAGVVTVARVSGGTLRGEALLFSGFHGEWIEPVSPLTAPA